MPSTNFRIVPAKWDTDRDGLLSVRHSVFVEEQRVPKEIEVDEFDPESFHVLAIETMNNQPIGTARLLPNGCIGRVAVLKNWRKHKVGSALMHALISKAQKEKFDQLSLHAQSWTIGFYEKLGFICEGKEFEEAGILHKSMRLILK